MNRYMVGIALALFLAGNDAAAGQTTAHVEYRNGRIGVGVVIGGLPVRVSPHGQATRGWVAADWGPVRISMVSRRPSWNQGTLDRHELRYLLGKETVKGIERHAKRMGVRGRTRGHWFRVDRTTTVLEVTVDRVPVAELYDYGNDGLIDQIFLTQPPRYARYKERGNDYRYGKGRKRW